MSGEGQQIQILEQQLRIQQRQSYLIWKQLEELKEG